MRGSIEPPCVKVFVIRAVSSDRFFGERATTGKQPLATGSRGCAP
jgi:hypothetical protein